MNPFATQIARLKQEIKFCARVNSPHSKRGYIFLNVFLLLKEVRVAWTHGFIGATGDAK